MFFLAKFRCANYSLCVKKNCSEKKDILLLAKSGHIKLLLKDANYIMSLEAITLGAF